MFEINRVFKLLRRTIVMVLLAGLIGLIGLPAASVQADAATGIPADVTKANKEGNRPFGERQGAKIIQSDNNDIDAGTKASIKSIQDQAEDLGNGRRNIGETGLKNIKKLGENIPETIELKARQVFGDD